MQQQVAEVAGVQHLQALLVEPVERLALVVGELGALGRRQLVRSPAAVLPVIDQAGQHLGRPSLGIDVFGFQHLFQEPFLIVCVEDGVVRLQPDQLGMTTKDLGRHGMERAQPAQPFGLGADDLGDPLAHLPRGLVGEGDNQQFPGAGPAGGQDVRQPRREHAGLAGAGAGKHQHGPLGRLDRRPLFRIEPIEIVGGSRVRPRQIADARARGFAG